MNTPSSTRLRRLALALLTSASITAGGRSALATTPEEEAQAEALFDQGRALMMEGKLDEACATLGESLRLHDRGDTALNVAECHRRQGKTATAWAEFDRAIEHGARVGYEDAIVVAKVRRDELAQILSTLTVTVPDAVAGLDGLVVELNGAPLAREEWNEATFRDPGSYQLVARAPGHQDRVLRVELGPRKDAQTLVVALEKVPPPPAPPPPPPPPPPPEVSTPIWPFVVGGAGVVLLGVSAGFGVASASAGADLDDACGTDRARCPESRRDDLESTRSTEVATFGAFVGLGAGGLVALGVAGVGLGLALSDEPAAATSITVGPGSLGLRRSF